MEASSASIVCSSQISKKKAALEPTSWSDSHPSNVRWSARSPEQHAFASPARTGKKLISSTPDKIKLSEDYKGTIIGLHEPISGSGFGLASSRRDCVAPRLSARPQEDLDIKGFTVARSGTFEPELPVIQGVEDELAEESEDLEQDELEEDQGEGEDADDEKGYEDTEPIPPTSATSPSDLLHTASAALAPRQTATSPASPNFPLSLANNRDPNSHLYCPDKPRHSKKKLTQGPPRPPNMWILFRTDARAALLKSYEDRKAKPPPESEVSRLLGQRWKNVSAEVRERYGQMASAAQEEHRKLYPGYKYAPTRTSVAKSVKAPALRKAKVAAKASLPPPPAPKTISSVFRLADTTPAPATPRPSAALPGALSDPQHPVPPVETPLSGNPDSVNFTDTPPVSPPIVFADVPASTAPSPFWPPQSSSSFAIEPAKKDDSVVPFSITSPMCAPRTFLSARPERPPDSRHSFSEGDGGIGSLSAAVGLTRHPIRPLVTTWSMRDPDPQPVQVLNTVPLPSGWSSSAMKRRAPTPHLESEPWPAKSRRPTLPSIQTLTSNLDHGRHSADARSLTWRGLTLPPLHLGGKPIKVPILRGRSYDRRSSDGEASPKVRLPPIHYLHPPSEEPGIRRRASFANIAATTDR